MTLLEKINRLLSSNYESLDKIPHGELLRLITVMITELDRMEEIIRHLWATEEE